MLVIEPHGLSPHTDTRAECEYFFKCPFTDEHEHPGRSSDDAAGPAALEIKGDLADFAACVDLFIDKRVLENCSINAIFLATLVEGVDVGQPENRVLLVSQGVQMVTQGDLILGQSPGLL